RIAAYEVTIKELGYRPQPYAIADAVMYADGKPIVEITDLTLQMTGLNRDKIETMWRIEDGRSTTSINPVAIRDPRSQVTLYNRDQILAFAVGNPSEAFGAQYRVFDRERFIARLPGPPYSFLDRITQADCEPFKLAAGGTIVAEYDIPADAWYF